MMQRMILRTITVLSVMCLCYLNPNQVLANNSEYGPERDPIPSEELLSISLTCPPPISVDCEDNGVYLTFEDFEMAGGGVNLPMGCEVDSFTFVEDVEISQNGCAFVFLRQYFISETCGNTFTCNQIVMLMDDDDPVIVDCPSDTTLVLLNAPCNVEFLPPEIETMDGCSAVTVVNDAPFNFEVGETVVTYTATDDCGNSSQCSFTVTVVPEYALTVTCPPDISDSTACEIIEIPAYADFAAFEVAGGSVTGQCNTGSTIYTIDNVNDEMIGGSCPKTVNRTYTISDEFGNEGTCTQMITVVDTMRPSFTVPANVIGVDCALLMDTTITGSPTNIMDNCDTNLVVTFMDSPLIAGFCDGQDLDPLFRTWIVTDECGNSRTAVQTIIPIDTTPPVAICQDTLVVYLDENGDADIEAEDLDDGSSDQCTDVSFFTAMSVASCNLVSSDLPITLEVSDECGNTAECDVVLVVLDTMAVVLTPPENDTVACITDVDPIFADVDEYELMGGGSVEDNCPAGSTFSMIEADTNGVCPIVITRTYVYEDFSDNTDTAVHTILIIDTIAPVIASCPPDISVSQTDFCDTLLVFGLPIIDMDNCGDVVITNNYTNDTSSMATFSGGVTEIIFTATDGCGNTDTCSMTVTVDAEPQITCPPMGEINSEDDLPDYATLDEFLMAGGALNAFCAFVDSTFMYSNTFEIDSTGCSANITETVSISDTLGNPTMVTKMSIAMDTINPQISGCFDMFVPIVHATCEIDTTFLLPMVDDNFGVDTSYFTVGAFIEDTAQVVFYAVDLCGNIDSCEFDLIVYDPTSPDIELDDITVMCDTTGAVPVYTTVEEFLTGPGALVYDCRLDSSSFMHDGDVVDMDGNIIRTYSIQDSTGNIGTTSQMITFMDNTNPEITMCTDDVAMNAETDTCGATVTIGVPTFMDNCNGTLTLTNDYNNTSDASGFYPVGETTVIWTVTDEEGLSDTCSFTVTITDMTPPVVSCPGDTTIECSISNYPPFTTINDFIAGGGEASDNCMLESISSVLDSTGTTYTRTYTIADASGLESTCVQTIEVIDTTAPMIDCPLLPIIVNTTSSTCDQFVVIPEPSASDNCGNVALSNSLTGMSDPSGTYSDTTSITWYAEDDFGNIDSCTYLIIVMDATGPVVSDPDTVQIMCVDMVADVDTFMSVQDIIDAGGSATDNCGIEFITLDTTIVSDTLVKRVYQVIDSTNNISTITQCISIEDTTNPEITTCTDNIAMNAETDTCGANVIVGAPIFMDNCTGTLTLTNDYTNTDDASGFYPLGVTTVIWTVTDEEGLSDTCSFTVTITDMTPPVVSCPGDTTIECTIDNYPPFTTIGDFIAGGGEASDNCMLGSISSVLDSTGTTYTRTYTIADASGLESTCVQTIEVIDTIAPMIDCPLLPIIVNTTSSTCDQFVMIPEPSASDNCGNVTLSNSLTGMSDPSGTYSDTTSITWYAEDDFGNIDSCTYLIIVMDATGPVVSDPDTVQIMCVDMVADVDTFMSVQDIIDAGGSATDNCGIEFITLDTTIVSDTLVKRVYQVIDSTNNISTITHCISIDDTTGPTFTAPADITIECDEDANDLSITGTVDSMLLADNCMDIDTLIFTDSVVPGACPLIEVITRIWILTDNSGNETRDTQVISTIDTVAPAFNSMPASLSDIDCNDEFPAFDMSITATDNCTGATVFIDTLPYTEDICSGYAVTYRWIAIDGCQNADTITRTFNVNPDDTPPSLVSINDVTVQSENDICGVYVDSIAGPIFEEDCSGFTLTRNYSDSIYHVGVNNVSWTATNECGIDSTVTQVVVVEDNLVPVPICKDAVAGITSDPQNYVPATSFIASIIDNCDIDSILVMRMDQGCGTNLEFQDSILICCEDVGQTIDVMIKVVDASGNQNFCNASLEVEDNRAPVVVEPLPNISISCAFILDTLDLEVFGSFTQDPGGREDIVIEDIFYENQDSIAGIDGLVSDECIVSIEDSTVVELDICNTGLIRRIFTFTDLSGNTTTSEQLILVQDVTPFNENGTDIIWPDDYTWNQCGTPAPDTSVSGAPIFLNVDKCAQVGASYKDQLFNFPTSSCPKLKRKWKVIDWCQYDESVTPNPGLWEYTQWIFVENTIPPTFTTACVDTLICAPNNECNAIVSLSIDAEDDCLDDTPFITYSYVINVNNDSNTSNDISGQGNSFSHELEQGVHEVTWTAQDRCGNDTTCTYLVTVEECKAPTAICLSGLVIGMTDTGEVELWASDVNQNSFDNCTDSDDLIFSFSSDTDDFGIVFDCDDIGTPQYIEMWVTDEEGNQSFCSTFVDVQDNNGYCSGLIVNDDQSSLQGKIATEMNAAIPEAMVSIIGAEKDDEYMTTVDGEYAFEEINIENDYQIKVARDKDDLEGVSTLDLVRIQRHILGLDILDSPYKLIAADVNNSESISASDMIELRKMILGINETFPDNESWRFVSMDSEMSDMNNPWPFSEDLILSNSPIHALEADFVGVKIGDVDNSIENLIAKGAIESRNVDLLGIITKDQKVHRDQEVLVDFVCNATMNLEALQMTIEWDKNEMNFVDVIPIGLILQDGYMNTTRVDEGILTIAWSSVDGKLISRDMPLFQLIFEGNESFDLSDHLNISSSLTQALAYDIDHNEYNVELSFIEGEQEGFMLFQNRPNPFVSETMVEFTLPEDMEVTFKVFNGAGSLIYERSQLYNEGENTFKLQEELGDHSGMLFLKMETAEFSDIKRMIRIE